MNTFHRISSLLLFSMLSINANAIVLGEDNGGNCYPFGCNASSWSTWTQFFDSSLFSESISINSISVFSEGDQVLSTSNIWNFSLGYINSSESSYNANQAQNNTFGMTQVYSGGAVNGVYSDGDKLTFNLDSSFLYDPTQGDLVWQVEAADPANFTATGFYTHASFDNYDGIARTWRSSDGASGTLVTELNGTPVAQVSEPSVLVLIGLGLLGFSRANRRQKV